MAREKTCVIVTTKTTTTVAPRRCGGRASLSRARAPPALGAALAGAASPPPRWARRQSPDKTPPPCREMDGAREHGSGGGRGHQPDSDPLGTERKNANNRSRTVVTNTIMNGNNMLRARTY